MSITASPITERIFLIGYRCTGKTTVAALLASELSWHWLDADVVLEQRAGKSIRQIFTDDGEPAFRTMEAAILTELSQLPRQVIATGGGVILRPENRLILRRSGWVVWLTAEPATIWQRMNRDASTTDRRPDLTVGGLAEIEELLGSRAPFYQECANYVINTEQRTPAEITEEILCQWRRAD